ncbi:MAG: hypothetical protein KBA26_03455 [Candidatus Delongbacteria bacterium]|nr:hypothetical protein [Candidatus Delongbacteria bacterium]
MIQGIWELPQNLVGILVMMILIPKIRQIHRWRQRILIRISGFGVSLGSFIFWYDPGPATCRNRTDILRHELGHSVQSKILGPLYLLIVGIPSACRYLYALRYFQAKKQVWTGYYHGYPEAWADRLGYGLDLPEQPGASADADHINHPSKRGVLYGNQKD